MKKTLIALAAVAAAGAASAQSSVTLFGIVDASISRYVVDQNNGLANGQGSNNTVMSNSGYNSSRLGFRGTEDLGGGLSASFWLEGQLQNDNGNASANNGGALTFQRRSTVSLAGAQWGELRLGRDYVSSFWNLTVFDPFGTVGVGANLAHKWRLYAASFNAAGTAITGGGTGSWDPDYVRANNMIGYFLPANLGGFYGQAQYAFDEVAQNAVNGSHNAAGRYIGARGGYGSGPFNIAIAYGKTYGTPTRGLGAAGLGGVGTLPNVDDWNVGGQWDFGVARLLATYDHTKYDAAAIGNATLKSWMIGGIVPVGAGEIKASYGHTVFDVGGNDPTTSQIAIGYVHNLSKRTALYTTYARMNNSNGATVPVNASLSQGPAPAGNSGIVGQPNVHSWGFDVGIRHSF